MGGFCSFPMLSSAKLHVNSVHTSPSSVRHQKSRNGSFLFYLAGTRGRSVKANHIFIAAVRQHRAIDSLRAAYRFRWVRSRGAWNSAMRL